MLDKFEASGIVGEPEEVDVELVKKINVFKANPNPNPNSNSNPNPKP
jgi:hypothetical protein